MPDIKRIEELEKEVEEVFLMEDDGVVRTVCATIISNRMSLDPVWLLLVAPSSGGKSEFINFVSGLDFVHEISDLTVNTFASGQQRAGKETSLLLKMGDGVMAFKDFTSVISKNKDARREIMAQLREIYDGKYTKRTGTGDDIVWTGRLGAIAGSTEIIYRYLEDLSAMGDRFVMYNIAQPDRLAVSKKALENTHKMDAYRAHLQNCFESYIKHVIENLDVSNLDLDESTKEELLHVADFATKVRSGVLTDYKTGAIDFVPAPEMPMRMTSQLYTIASAFIAMDDAAPASAHTPNRERKLTELQKKILYKIAFSSIPRTRRDALTPLAKYRGGISTAGLATHLGLQTSSVRKYLEQINALGICQREKRRGGAQGDFWVLKNEYRDVIVTLEGIKVLDKQLIASDVTEEDDEEAMDDALDAWDDYADQQGVDSLDNF